MFNQNSDNGADDGAVQQAYQDPNWQHPGAPLDDNGGAAPDPSAAQPAGDSGAGDNTDSTATQSVPVTTYQAGHDAGAPAAPASDGHGSGGGSLDTIKRQALSQLTPIVDRLDQTPEEKFRTLMMMIQSGDDQSLIQAAYAAAGEIQDETARAQALLDVVNEINYFNSQNQ